MQPKIIRSLLLALGLLAGAATGHAQFNQSADVDQFTDLGNGLVRHVFGTLGHTGTFIRVESNDRSLANLRMTAATLAAVNDKFVMRVVAYNVLADIPGFTSNFRRSAEVYTILGYEYCVITATGSASPPPSGRSTPTATNKPVNVSTLVLCPVGGLVTAGFVLEDAGSQQILVRAIGPGLTSLGVSGALANPRLTVNKGATVIKTNDDWSGNAPEASALTAAFTAVGAFGIANGSKDSAVLLTLDSGAYTVQAGSADAGASGLVLLEVYVVKK